MNEDSNNKVDTLGDITPVEFKWDESNISIGVVAQEIGTIDLSDYSIGSSANTVSIASNSWTNGNSFSFGSSDTFNAGTTEYGKTTIKTARSTIDIDELADMMETLKKRLLILTPNFEMHEKYPMLKELYNEYKAMERLLSGPDTNE
jgi:hypothetical protein